MKIGNMEVYGVIYKVVNKVNNKVYIGQTVNGFNTRYSGGKGSGVLKLYNHHKNRRNKGYDYNDHLLKSIIKYGVDNFDVIEVFDVAFSKTELNLKETFYIDLYNSKNPHFGYNKADGGNLGNGVRGSRHFNSKKVYCVTTDKSFDTLREASDFYNISAQTLSIHLRGELNRVLINKQATLWMYYEDYVCISEEELEYLKYKSSDEYHSLKLKEGHTNDYCKKKVICLTTGEVFDSCKEAIEKYNAKNLSKCLKGKTKYCGKHPITKEKLKWDYYKK